MLGAIQDATSNRQKSTRQKPTRQIQQNCQLVKSQFVKKPTRQTTNSPKEFSRQNSYIEERALEIHFFQVMNVNIHLSI